MFSPRFFRLNRNMSAYMMFLIALLLIPLFVKNEYFLRILVMIFIYSTLALGLNFIAGYVGLLSFGHAAFYGIGAYTTAILMTRYGFGFVPAFAASGIITFMSGVFLGLPLLRVRGDYLVLVTLAFGEIFRVLMQGLHNFSGGQMGIVGIPVPTIFGFRIFTNVQFYYVAFALVAFSLATLAYIESSKIGRAMMAIREDELAANTLGINTAFYKLLGFAIGTFFAGIAGSLLSVYLTAIAPSNFTLGESVLVIIMVIVGGLGSLPGSIIGAGVIISATELFRPVYQYRLLIIGSILVIVLSFHPQGIMGIKAWKRSNKDEGA